MTPKCYFFNSRILRLPLRNLAVVKIVKMEEEEEFRKYGGFKPCTGAWNQAREAWEGVGEPHWLSAEETWLRAWARGLLRGRGWRAAYIPCAELTHDLWTIWQVWPWRNEESHWNWPQPLHWASSQAPRRASIILPVRFGYVRYLGVSTTGTGLGTVSKHTS